ncbi:unnamed protein product [Lactuca saligna]|uniref:Organ specific protein n=1 Tax=Lactuca saligna TaxID=75948 RepID=A0AA35ZLA1_LACSI|nr:unnamed protein product [Lactuca saligna]
MESHFSFLALFFLVMITVTVYARPNPEEYQQDLHVRGGSLVSHDATKRSDCHQRKSFNADLEPRPDILIYDNSVGLKSKKTFVEDIKPIPNLSVYENGSSVKGKRTFDEEFEPRPSVTAYQG